MYLYLYLIVRNDIVQKKKHICNREEIGAGKMYKKGIIVSKKDV